jgi:hypothetical protein
MMSGNTSNSCAANGEPVRPKPVTGDHLVEDQQQAVFVADLAQALQVPDRRQHHAGGTGDRLDDHRGDGRGVVQRHQPFELVGEFRAVCRQAAREGIAREVVRVRQVVHPGDHRRRPRLAIGHHAADADAAETHAMVTALAA